MNEDELLEQVYEDNNGAPRGDEQEEQDYPNPGDMHEPRGYTCELDWLDSDLDADNV